MKFGAISFDAAKKVVLNILNITEDRSFNLIPNEILNLILEQKLPFSRKSIPNWEDFSYGHSDITTEDLLSFTSIPLFSDAQLFVVTDPCFLDLKQGLMIKAFELIDFTDNYYPEMFEEEFVQPSDIILVCEKTKLISMIHHEGEIFEYNGMTLNS